MTFWDQEDEELLQWCRVGGTETLQERRELDAEARQMYFKPDNLPGAPIRISHYRPVVEMARDIHSQIYGDMD